MNQQTPARPERPDPDAARPDVIVDFALEGPALVVSVRNLGPGCAHRIRTSFEPEFRGAGGTISIPELALFERLRFLAPGGEVQAFVDVAARYFGRGEPEVIDVVVAYTDDAGRRYRRRLSHDLGVFRDLPVAGGH